MPKAKHEAPSVDLRLQKFIADCGITSRRKAEQMIVNGEVKVNGQVCRELGTKVNPDSDTVEIDGQVLNLLSVEKVYLLLNKPRGVVTTVSDPEGRPTVIDYCRGIDVRIFPVGRLDFHSEGLLIMTNDGEMANLIMHPRYEVTKVYEVKIFGAINEGILSKLRNGMQFPEGFVKPKSVRVVETLPNKTWIEFRLAEGKNREIRRLCEACDLTIDKLRRVAIEGLTIQNLAPGNFLMLTKKELLKALGINEDGTKRKDAKDFVSAKRTIEVKDRVTRRATRMIDRKTGTKVAKLASDPSFARYRKETYKETIAEQKKMAELRGENTTGRETRETDKDKATFKKSYRPEMKKTGRSAPVRSSSSSARPTKGKSSKRY